MGAGATNHPLSSLLPPPYIHAGGVKNEISFFPQEISTLTEMTKIFQDLNSSYTH